MPKSGYRGVTWKKDKRRWQVIIKHAGELRYFGYYDDAEYAARVFDCISLALRGDDARVPHEFLECGKASASLDPAAAERVTQLMDMEPTYAAASSYSVRTRSWRPLSEGHESSNSKP